MGELDLWSGHVSKNDPAAFLSLRSKPRKKGGTGSGGVTSRVHAVANTDYDEPDESKKSSAYLTLAGDSANGSECWLEAQDANGEVGVGANIGTGYVHLGGYLGGITNRSHVPCPGCVEGVVSESRLRSIATGASMQVDLHVQPDEIRPLLRRRERGFAMGGHHRASDATRAGRAASQLKLYNADQPCPVECVGRIPRLSGQMIGGNVVSDFRNGREQWACALSAAIRR